MARQCCCTSPSEPCLRCFDGTTPQQFLLTVPSGTFIPATHHPPSEECANLCPNLEGEFVLEKFEVPLFDPVAELPAANTPANRACCWRSPAIEVCQSNLPSEFIEDVPICDLRYYAFFQAPDDTGPVHVEVFLYDHCIDTWLIEWTATITGSEDRSFDCGELDVIPLIGPRPGVPGAGTVNPGMQQNCIKSTQGWGPPTSDVDEIYLESWPAPQNLIHVL